MVDSGVADRSYYECPLSASAWNAIISEFEVPTARTVCK